MSPTAVRKTSKQFLESDCNMSTGSSTKFLSGDVSNYTQKKKMVNKAVTRPVVTLLST